MKTIGFTMVLILCILLAFVILFPRNKLKIYCSALNVGNQLADLNTKPVSLVDSKDASLNYPSVHEKIDLSGNANLNVDSFPLTEEQQLETILRTFRKLPPDEVQRFNLDLSDETIIVGTERAENLKAAWKLRQEELREAMKSVMKPAEYMGNLTQQLEEKASSFHRLRSQEDRNQEELFSLKEEINQLLIDLESLLTDIDNSRDFHTIGAWPTLVSFLSSSYPLSTRAKAAWALGTVMKNSYDFQLWTLENNLLPIRISPAESPSIQATYNSTCLTLLLQMFNQSALLMSKLQPGDRFYEDAVEFQKRTIYALSSAVRGNIDVQDHIQLFFSEIFFQSLESYLSLSSSGTAAYNQTKNVTIMRKVFSLISDLLEERQYIRYELSAFMRSKLLQTSNSPQAKEVDREINTVANDLQDLTLLSDYFFHSALTADSTGPEVQDWSVSTLYLLNIYLQQLKMFNPRFHSPSEISLAEELRNEWVSTHLTIQTILKIYVSYFQQIQHLFHRNRSPLLNPAHREFAELLVSLLHEITQSPTFTEHSSYEDMVKQARLLQQTFLPLVMPAAKE